eukprot:gnl/Dysnectes_brevis/1588_a1799_2845.p1 GENE.gnl/Dysnectes_brevis/1588_a1799_2845~~gnl/Dysnectes_brevis/1588_a1799_2845.p1  ORF type:complete len:220 (+),score=27.48 gnl/Dysnectes_brevis/1588_a1799_2845:32-661(+)
MATPFTPQLLLRVQKTVIEMLNDRGFIVPGSDVLLTETEEHMANRCGTFSDDDLKSLCLQAVHQDNTENKIQVHYSLDTKKLALERVCKELERHAGVKHVIFIYQNKAIQLDAQVKNLLQHRGLRFECFHFTELLVNISHHALVPKHQVLSRTEKLTILKELKAVESQMPRIRITDPMARYMGIVCGQMVRIVRHSETAGRYVTYRLCY